ncbi:isoaspartyl peptidase/L-asparaginase [Aspergillus homomorphus CBS 101889]|uniref:N-terminal nucleophile aminohydrolase n=1 Tax=Aspergillus homomorphus (strain CBS 101889) TaxID=1450537 RepID=A0A395IBC9_ASPHC|nr:N-terminal nucleophile aminohydrolase [Aspergillus homomorphus CBS 101889]RAL16388.1 N-terminal nucleophile aminohydrolase [Aspergillus homomorphus CBS 101889]
MPPPPPTTIHDPNLPALFHPTLILHGGAGAIHRATLPPDLYAQYHASLLTYLRSTRALLASGASALDAAVHAVALMEDDPLFNCGRGSVFTAAGTIEMEASLMVTSVVDGDSFPGVVKRGAGVMRLRNVQHPIRLAREVLLRDGLDDQGQGQGQSGGGGGGSMHSQLVAPYVEDVLARRWGLEFMPDEWFFTQRRWDEHLRGLKGLPEEVSLSQGTVGCVCLDRWGGLAVATSTGGLTNKLPGRVGDTPTLGAGFWAEGWEGMRVGVEGGIGMGLARKGIEEREGGLSKKEIWDMSLGDCVPGFVRQGMDRVFGAVLGTGTEAWLDRRASEKEALIVRQPTTVVQRHKTRRAVAVSGTGNGDSFLRTAAARTACAIARFSTPSPSLAQAVAAVAGPGGELQRSAGERWGTSGEGQGGIIGIEAELEDAVPDDDGMATLRRGKVVFDFNCGGMWRAWVEDLGDGKEVERVMVFRDEYR